VILVGPEKLVTKLGERGKLPVEVIPFGQSMIARSIQVLGLDPVLRMDGARVYVTDNGNHILDCRTGVIDDPQRLQAALVAIPGVVGTGLFLNMRPTVLAWNNDRVEVHTFE
jgi:ribose 5-phosphate isomerase A